VPDSQPHHPVIRLPSIATIAGCDVTPGRNHQVARKCLGNHKTGVGENLKFHFGKHERSSAAGDPIAGLAFVLELL